jgi:hypothetical protein
MEGQKVHVDALESWSLKGSLSGLRGAFKDFHPDVRRVLDACPDTHKWPIFDGDPQPSWGIGRVYLLGDACHPMTPYMAQGAASAIEDAAILARCLEGVSHRDLPQALRRYEAMSSAKMPRISDTAGEIAVRAPGSMPARVEVEMDGGERLVSECLCPPGYSFPERGLDRDVTVRKFHDVSDGLLGADAADDMVLRFARGCADPTGLHPFLPRTPGVPNESNR